MIGGCQHTLQQPVTFVPAMVSRLKPLYWLTGDLPPTLCLGFAEAYPSQNSFSRTLMVARFRISASRRRSSSSFCRCPWFRWRRMASCASGRQARAARMVRQVAQAAEDVAGTCTSPTRIKRRIAYF